MSQVACPHCGAANEPGAFCVSCGKALPKAMPSGPRVVGGAQLAQTAVGQDLQSDALRKQVKKAAGALIAVAILQTLVAFLITSVLPQNVDPGEKTGIMIMLFGVAALFYGLFFWALKQPFPAAIVGLVVYVSLLLLDAVMDPASIVKGIIVKLIIIGVLVKAIQAGMMHRQLLQQAR